MNDRQRAFWDATYEKYIEIAQYLSDKNPNKPKYDCPNLRDVMLFGLLAQLVRIEEYK